MVACTRLEKQIEEIAQPTEPGNGQQHKEPQNNPVFIHRFISRDRVDALIVVPESLLFNVPDAGMHRHDEVLKVSLTLPAWLFLFLLIVSGVSTRVKPGERSWMHLGTDGQVIGTFMPESSRMTG